MKLSADDGIQAAFFWSVRGAPQCARRDQLHWLFLCGLQQRCRPATAGRLLRDWFSPRLAVHESMGDSDAAGCRTSRPCVQVLLLCCFNFAAVAPQRPATVEPSHPPQPPPPSSRASCKEYLPGGSTGICELVSLPLQTIVRVLELIIAKAATSKRILLAPVKARDMFPQPAVTVPGATASDPSALLLLPLANGTTAKDARPLRPHLHYSGGSRRVT